MQLFETVKKIKKNYATSQESPDWIGPQPDRARAGSGFDGPGPRNIGSDAILNYAALSFCD